MAVARRFDVYSQIHSTTTLNAYFERGFYSFYINRSFYGLISLVTAFTTRTSADIWTPFGPVYELTFQLLSERRGTPQPRALSGLHLWGEENLPELLYKHAHNSCTRFNLIFAETSPLNSHFPPGAFIAIHRPHFDMTFEHVPAVSV